MAAMAPGASDKGPAKLSVMKDELYEQCMAAGDTTTLFTQEDLLDFGITQDIHVLLNIIQQLSDEKLMIMVNRQGGGYLFRWRSAADAEKYRPLNREQSMVYEMIEEAGADGIWSRTLKARLGMHDSVLKQHLKHLENKNYIKDMKSVEHPNKKMYIKAGLRPSEKATGGPWYTDGNLDEAFINDLLKVIFDIVTKRSTYTSGARRDRQPKKGILRGDASAAGAGKGKKRAAEDISTDEPSDKSAAKSKSVHGPKRTQLLPMPAGFKAYPTTRQIAQTIDDNGITSGDTLSVADVQQLVDLLVYDGLIEPVRVGKTQGYRTVRPAAVDPTPLTPMFRSGAEDDVRELDAGDMGADPLSNGFTEAPCGRCPVFDLCEEGGPVSPGNCVYFQRWLGF